jgi:gas vesicle protein
MSQTRCFFYGVGVGVAAALLMAPRSGVKTRRRLIETAREGQDYIVREGEELRDTIAEKVNRAKRAAKVTAEGIGVAMEAGKQQLAG